MPRASAPSGRLTVSVSDKICARDVEHRQRSQQQNPLNPLRNKVPLGLFICVDPPQISCALTAWEQLRREAWAAELARPYRQKWMAKMARLGITFPDRFQLS